MTEQEQDLHATSLTFATHLTAPQTPTLPKKEGNELKRKLIIFN
jgi:hypothetical protein